MNCASFCMQLLNPALVITDFYLNDAKQPQQNAHSAGAVADVVLSGFANFLRKTKNGEKRTSDWFGKNDCMAGCCMIF